MRKDPISEFCCLNQEYSSLHMHPHLRCLLAAPRSPFSRSDHALQPRLRLGQKSYHANQASQYPWSYYTLNIISESWEGRFSSPMASPVTFVREKKLIDYKPDI